MGNHTDFVNRNKKRSLKKSMNSNSINFKERNENTIEDLENDKDEFLHKDIKSMTKKERKLLILMSKYKNNFNKTENFMKSLNLFKKI